MVASVTMVSGRPCSSRPSGVACVSTTLAVPSPSTMCITMVRASGQVNSARTGTPQVRLSRKVTSTTSVRSSEASSSTTRCENAYGWNHDPCQGSSRLAITSCGSQTPGCAITARHRLAQRRPGRQRRPLGGRLARGGQADPDQHPVVVGRVRAPGRGRPRAVNAIPCQRQYIVPSSTGQLSISAPEMRAERRTGDQVTAGVAPEHHLAAGDGPGHRLRRGRRRRSSRPRTSRRSSAPGTPPERAAIRAGLASRQDEVIRFSRGCGTRAIGIRGRTARAGRRRSRRGR